MVWGVVVLLSLAVNALDVPLWIDVAFCLLGACYMVYAWRRGGRRPVSALSCAVCIIAAFAMGFGLYLGQRVDYYLYRRCSFALMLPVCAYCWLLFFTLSRDAGLFSRALENGRRKPRPADWLLLALFLLVILLSLYMKEYPHIETPDTINQWDQIHGAISYHKIHSIGHTIFLKALLSLWDDYRFVIAVHVLGVIGLYLLFASWFCAKGIPVKTVALAEGLCLLWTHSASKEIFSPAKDLPAALCLGLVTFFLLRLQDKDRLSGGEAFALGLALAWAALFRMNGIIAAGVCGLYVLVCLWRRSLFRPICSLLLAVVLSAAGVKSYTDLVLKPREFENGFAVQVFASGIASVAVHDELSPEEEAAVSELLSVDWMKDTYINSLYKQRMIWVPDGSERIAANPNLEVFNNDFVLALGANRKAVVLLYLKLLPHHLPLMVKDFLGSIKLIWAIDKPSLTSNQVFLTALVLVLALRLRLKMKDLLIFLPCFCNVLSICISTITNEIRYLLPSFLLLPFFLLYFLWKSASVETVEST